MHTNKESKVQETEVYVLLGYEEAYINTYCKVNIYVGTNYSKAQELSKSPNHKNGLTDLEIETWVGDRVIKTERIR